MAKQDGKNINRKRRVLIIGNGGSCLSRRIGHLVDQFDGLIVRFNEYEITGYEQFIGTRTDIHATHRHIKVGKYVEKRKPKRLTVPDTLRRRVKKELKLKDPTTGLLTVYYYQNRGFEVFIHGFDHFASGVLTHYFGAGVSGQHNGTQEREYFDTLIQEKKITVFGQYSEPVITVVMPFHNEGDEPRRTLESLYANTPENSFNVIAIDDKSDRNRNGAIKSFPRVKVIRNLIRRGVDSSRTIGGYYARTKYLIFIDGHMRFSVGWLDAYIRELEKSERNVVYCKTGHVVYDYETPLVNKGGRQKHGCDFSILKLSEVLSMKWVYDKPAKPVTETRGLMGANYGMHRQFFMDMKGLEGLREYGMPEEFLALKTLWFGGKIIYIDDVVISHLYRNLPVYRTDKVNYLYNKIFILSVLFTVKEANRLIDLIPDSGQKGVAIGQIKANKKYIRDMKNEFKELKKYTYRRFVNKYKLLP